MSLVDLIGQTVNLKKSGQEFIGQCPFHQDKKPSLSVNEEKGLWTCYGCGAGGSAFDWVMKRDKVDFTEAQRRLEEALPVAPKEERRIVATYDYTDAEGKLLFQVVRYQPKTFVQRRPDGKGGWLYNLKGVESVLYKLPTLITADTVYLVEGEKDADRLIAGGMVATTSPGGASAWKPQFAQSLQGKKVIIIPDNDAEGERYANSAIASLRNVAREVLICRLPGLAHKGDVSDWLDLGNDIKALGQHCQKPDTEPKLEVRSGLYKFTWAGFTATVSRVIEERRGTTSGEIRVGTTLPGFDPVLVQGKLSLLSPRSQVDLARRLEEKCPSQDWKHLLELISRSTLEALRQGEPILEVGGGMDDHPVPLSYVLEPIILTREPTLLFGDGGSGKSYLALYLALLVSEGLTHCGLRVSQPTPVLYLDWERHEDEIKRRLLQFVHGGLVPSAMVFYRRCTSPLADELDEIQQEIEYRGVGLLVLDSLLGASGEELERAGSVAHFMKAYRRLNKAGVIVTHTQKGIGEKTAFGSAYWKNLGTSVWEVRGSINGDGDTLSLGLFHRKINLGRLHKPLAFRFAWDKADRAIVVSPTDALKEPGLAVFASLPARIKEALKSGALTAEELADELGKTKEDIGPRLSELRSQGQIIRLPGDYPYRWGLSALPGQREE